MYDEMATFYKRPRKHDSPTKRLKQQMDTAWTQKEFLSKQTDYRANKEHYGLTYVVGVSNTYHVQPENGELPYDMVEKSPKKFYKEVMDSKVFEHRVSKSPKKRRDAVGEGELPKKRRVSKSGKLQYRNRICKRSVARILQVVQSKMRNLVRMETGEVHSPDEIQRAIAKPRAEKLLQRQITDGSVKLVK